MWKPIPTLVHGILDYVTAPTLVVLPRMLGMSKRMTNVLTGSAVGLLGYSVVTRYELGIFKLLPMVGHLAMDCVSGAMLAGTPFMFGKKRDRNNLTIGLLAGMGLYEIVVALLTQTRTSLDMMESENEIVAVEMEMEPGVV
ncbi:MAG TPA: hypothetical protein VFA41_04705 [Ktedonobacteraceae bacterium]|jgi:hypothetical protein|nr:hypothetical protein [Ktedonobacteraceae bacterium]